MNERKNERKKERKMDRKKVSFCLFWAKNNKNKTLDILSKQTSTIFHHSQSLAIVVVVAAVEAVVVAAVEAVVVAAAVEAVVVAAQHSDVCSS